MFGFGEPRVPILARGVFPPVPGAILRPVQQNQNKRLVDYADCAG